MRHYLGLMQVKLGLILVLQGRGERILLMIVLQ